MYTHTHPYIFMKTFGIHLKLTQIVNQLYFNKIFLQISNGTFVKS